MTPTDEALEVTFLGTGAAMPTASRAQTGISLREGGRRLLIDCGSGVLHRLERSGIGYEAVDTLLFTHHHLDHVADLLPVMKARWLAGETSMTVVGPPGTESLLAGELEVHDYMQGRIDLTVREIEPGEHTVAGFDVTAVETVHSMYCLAYRFDDRLTLSGDTEPSEAVVELADGSAVLVHECAFPDDVDVTNHTRPTELGRVLGGIDVGRVYLTHFYPHCGGREEAMAATVEAGWGGDVRPAEDGLTLRIRDSDVTEG